MSRRRSPSDLRRRAERKVERNSLIVAGLLKPLPQRGFRFFALRRNPRRTVFEAPHAQEELNRDICCSRFDDAPMEHSGGRLSVMTRNASALAEELISQGWVKV